MKTGLANDSSRRRFAASVSREREGADTPSSEAPIGEPPNFRQAMPSLRFVALLLIAAVVLGLLLSRVFGAEHLPDGYHSALSTGEFH